MEGNYTQSPLMEKSSSTPTVKKLAWFTEASDLFVLLCSFLLTTTSIVLLVLIFHMEATPANQTPESESKVILSYLQRVISTLSLTITSAMIMVAGKRYVLLKLARGGLRSRRVAVYSDPTIGNLANYLVFHGVEFPLLGLSAVWGLALVTGLTVTDSLGKGPLTKFISIPNLSGPLDLEPPSNSSWVTSAIDQLAFVSSTWCLGLTDTLGLTAITSANADPSNPEIIYYPPFPFSFAFQPDDYSLSIPKTMNGFNVSLEELASVPSTASNITTCIQKSFVSDHPAELWYDGSDNQTLSLVIISNLGSTFRINATAIVLGGTLSSDSNNTVFTLDGTSWPNVMLQGNPWAQDIIQVICNATFESPATLSCDIAAAFEPVTFFDFVVFLYESPPLTPNTLDRPYWSSVLNMALGAYSFAMFSSIQDGNLSGNDALVTWPGYYFKPTYGAYILLLNIVASIVMFIVVVRLRTASHLGPDFLNSTRLLLNPLKKPELFNASLKTTVDAFTDPYMLVEETSFLVAEQKKKRAGETGKRFELFALLPERHAYVPE